MRSKLLLVLLMFTLCLSYAQDIISTNETSLDTSAIALINNLEEIEIELENVNKTIFRLDSLLQTKANRTLTEEYYQNNNNKLLNIRNIIQNNIQTGDYKIKHLENKLENQIAQIQKTINQKINVNCTHIEELNEKIASVLDSVSVTAKTIVLVEDQTNTKLLNINEKNRKRALYWIITISLVFLIVIVLFFVFRLKIIEQKKSLSVVRDTQKKLENKSIQTDTKLLQIFEKKLETANLQEQNPREIDHSLPIKLGEEIHRMRKRLRTMEESQGTKVLRRRIESLEDKLNEMGYKIIDLVGRSFNNGMELGKAQFIPDDALKDGERIITRVIKPQINFKDVIIQPADVEISQGN